MHDVIGYEEKDPAVTKHLRSGYPRFVLHQFNQQLTTLVATDLARENETLWLTSSSRTASDLVAELGGALAKLKTC